MVNTKKRRKFKQWNKSSKKKFKIGKTTKKY